MSQQNTQSHMVKPLPVKTKIKPSDFPGMDSAYYNSPAMNKKYGDKPAKVSPKKKSLPSKTKVMSSIRKSMGYKK